MMCKHSYAGESCFSLSDYVSDASSRLCFFPDASCLITITAVAEGVKQRFV